MTPQEQSDYKMRWAPGFSVRLHSDIDWKGKDWCRKNLERHQWAFDSWTNVYEHTFRFEHEHHAKAFEAQWPEFTNQEAA